MFVFIDTKSYYILVGFYPVSVLENPGAVKSKIRMPPFALSFCPSGYKILQYIQKYNF